MKPISDEIYKVAEIITGKKKKWMQQMTKKKKFEEGALRRHFGLKKNETMTVDMIERELKKLEEKYPEGGYSKSDLELQRRLQAALNMMTR